MARSRRTVPAKAKAGSKRAESYAHPEATSLLRPDVGTQAQFRKKKPPQRYRYDSSLSPALDWDGQNAAREQGEAQLAGISGEVALTGVEMEQRELLEHVTRTIVEKFHPHRVILFGSRARGDARPDSDIDLLIEMETTQTPPERAIEISAAFGLRPWPLDVLVYTPEEVKRLHGVAGTLLSVIEREGKILYESA